MNRRRAIPALLAALILGLVVAAVAGGLNGGDAGSRKRLATAPTPSVGSRGGARPGHVSPGSAVPNQSSPGAPEAPDPHARRHPRVPARMRTYPRLGRRAGGRNTTFTLSFRLRRNLGPHAHTWSYYGVIVSPLARHPHHGCYGFGRYVMRGRKGQIARVRIHPHGRLWCAGTYQADVYLTGRPYCPPSRHPHACSTASYAAIPTGWTYFSVR